MPQPYDTGVKRVEVVSGDALGKATLNVSVSAVGLPTIPARAEKAFITTEGQQVRYWVDGSNPTVSAGHLLEIGSVLILDSRGQLTNFKAIAVTGTAVLQITYS